MISYRPYFQVAALIFIFSMAGCVTLGKKNQAAAQRIVEPGTTLHVLNVIEQDEVTQVAFAANALQKIQARLRRAAQHQSKDEAADESTDADIDADADADADVDADANADTEEVEEEVSAELETVRDAVENYDALDVLSYQINAAFRGNKAFVVKNIHSASEHMADFAEYLQSIPEDGLLLLSTQYFFSADMRALRVETNVGLYLKNPGEGKKAGRTVYSNELVYHEQIDAPSPEQAAEAWAQDDGEKVIAALDAGLAEISRLLLLDLSGSAPKKASKKSWTIADMKKAGDVKISGTVLRSENNRVVMRHATGVLMSIPVLGKSS